MRIRSVACAVLLAGLVPVGAATAAERAACTAAALPELPGTTTVSVTGTDGNGTYVGTARSAEDGLVGVVWRNGGVEQLAEMIPDDINASGLMGGYVYQDSVPDGDIRVAAVQQLDGPVDVLAVSYAAWVGGVNDQGDAVGYVVLDHPVGFYYSARWPAEGDQVIYPGNQDVQALEIDDLGYAVGHDGYGGGIIWGPDNTVLHDFTGDAAGIDPIDVDNGVAVAIRTATGEQPVIIRIDAASGRASVLPGSTGVTPSDIAGGNIVGNTATGATLWRGDGATELPPLTAGALAHADVVTQDGTQVAGVSGTGEQAAATLWTCG